MVDLAVIFSLFVLGIIFAIITALIGVGQGLMTVPVLIFVFGVNSIDATLISTFTLVFGRSSGFLKYNYEKRMDFRSGWIFLIFMMPGAILGALLAESIDEVLLKQVFGIFVGIVSIRGLVLLYFNQDDDSEIPTHEDEEDDESRLMSIKNNEEIENYRRIIDREGDIYKYLVDFKLALPLSFFGGFIAGLLGIGGSIFLIPVMNSIAGIPIHMTVPTSTFMIMIMTVVALITRLTVRATTGTLDIVYLLSFGLPLALGSIFGGFIGASFSKRFNPNQLKIPFWIIGVLVAIRMIVA